MNTMKKLLALLLATLMLLTLCACGDKQEGKDVPSNVTPQEEKDVLTPETLQGEWTLKLDLAALMQNDMLDDLTEGVSGFDFSELDVTAELDTTFKDGKMTVDPDDVTNLYKDVVESIIDWIAEGDNLFEMLAASEGVSAEEYKKALEAEGYTKDLLLPIIMDELPDTDELVSDIDSEISEMCYELDGDKLYTWDAEDGEKKDNENYMVFTYADNTITVIKGIDGDDVIEFDEGDFVLVRK